MTTSNLIEHRTYSLARPAEISERREADPEAGTDVVVGLTFTGYASVFDYGYDIWGGPARGGWTEYIDQGAFTKTLKEKPDVELLINHDGLPLARTKSGTLTLTQDDNGLWTEANLEPSDPDVQRIVPKMKRGDLDEMSFAFRVTRQTWLNEAGEEVDSWLGTQRHIKEVSIHRGDVSIVSYGANDATSADLRDLDRALTELRAGRALRGEQMRALRNLLADPAAPTAPAAPAAPAAARRSTRTLALMAGHR